MSNKCPNCGSEYFGVREDDTCLSCGWHRVTVFDRITASPEVLAEKLVYVIKQLFTISGTSRENPGGYEVKTKWFSTIVDGEFDRNSEVIAATVAKLKEVADDTK